MRIEYLQSGSLQDLGSQVGEYLAQGWIPHGPIVVWYENTGDMKLTWFIQAITIQIGTK